MDGSIMIVNDDDSTEEIVFSPADTSNPSPRATRSRENGITSGPSPAPQEGSPAMSAKKRRRTILTPSPKTNPDKSPAKPAFVDDDDGSICPICLDHWEMNGEHRLTSLKCGHLYGFSCIRRWLQECAVGAKSCPSCKTKATARDFRYLYAKKLCVMDNTEAEALKVVLVDRDAEIARMTQDKIVVDFELQRHRQRVKALQDENDYLRRRLANPVNSGVVQSSQQLRDLCAERFGRLAKVRLFLNKTIDLSKEPGCRMMASSRSDRLLFVSQKSAQNLFPGYGLRYIDLETSKPTTFVHVSTKQIRDLIVTDHAEGQPNYILTTTMESCARLYDVTGKSLVQTFKPTSNNGQPEEQIWCCAFGQNDEMWFGGQRGTVYQFDKRQPTQPRTVFKSEGDMSPMINVAFVPAIPEVLPFGGVMVCKLKELCFYQFLDASYKSTRVPVNIEGPFSSMSYDPVNGYVLVMTRCGKMPSRYIMCKFERLPDTSSVMLVVKNVFAGSDVMPVVSRPLLYHVAGSDSVVMTAYLQSTRMLTTWALETNQKLQSMQVADTILDVCPVYIRGLRMVATLTETKCRVFEVHEERM